MADKIFLKCSAKQKRFDNGGSVINLGVKVADLVARLDEGAADIMRADDAEFERYPRLLGIADSGRRTRIGHRDDEIGVDTALDRKLSADRLAHRINRRAVYDRVGPREIDMLEDAGARPRLGEGADRAHPLVRDDDHLSRFDLADERGTDDVEPDCLRGEDIGVADPAHHQRTDAERISAGDHPLRGQTDQRIGALDLLECIDEAIEQGAIFRHRDQMNDRFGVTGRLEDRAGADEIATKLDRIGDIAVMGDRETTRRKLRE